MKNPSEFGQFDYTTQQGCPDFLANAWFAMNHNYKVVAVGETKEEAQAWLETQTLILEDSRGAAVDCYEEFLREGTEPDALYEIVKGRPVTSTQQ